MTLLFELIFLIIIMKKNLAITGGYGFLGNNLVKILNSNFNIIFLEKPSKIKKAFHKQSKIKIFDISKVNVIFLKKYKINTIIHLAWTTRYFNSKLMQKKNFLISKKLLNSSLKANCNFIFSSTSAIYGDSLLKKPYLNEYAKFKLKFENHLKHFFSLKNKIYCLRLFNIYGNDESKKKDKASSVYKFVQSLKNTKKIILYKGIKYQGKEISPSREWLFVKDACKIIKILISKKIKNGIYDVSCKEKISFDYLASLIIKQFGYGEIKYSKIPSYKKLNYQRHNFSTDKHISSLIRYKFTGIIRALRI